MLSTEKLKEQMVNDLYNLIGDTCILPQKAQMPEMDKDLEVAELLAEKMCVFDNVFTPNEMALLRKWIWEKRKGGG